MTDLPDSDLLTAFLTRRDEQAFAALVRRYLGLVYSAALRQVRDVHFAEEAAHAVFIVLARKAGAVRPPSALPGWLIGTTRNLCRDLLKRERRRQNGERKAAAMKSELEGDESLRDWQEIAPQIDNLLARLKEPDRSALVMRFLEGRSLSEVAAALGVSPDTASKRISRALAKVRARLAGKGFALSTPAISAALAHATAPFSPGLSHAVTAAGLSAAKGTAAGSAAILAKGAMTAMRAKIVWSGIAAVALVLIAGAAVVHVVARRASAPVASANGASATGGAAAIKPATRPPGYKPIKAGVIVSLFTATGPTWIGKPYGYVSTVNALKELRDPSVELIPVIEAGSDSDPELQAVLKRNFPGKSPVIAIDSAHLADLDVIVAIRICNAPDELLTAVEGRVKEGAGLLIRRCFGVVTPEFTPQVAALNGFVDAQHGLGSGPGTGKVVAQHPILGTLKIGQTIRVGFNGAYGDLSPGGVALLQFASGNFSPVGTNTRLRDAFVFNPLYVSQLGKGRIIGCSFTEPVPAELNSASGGRFTLHCLQWLAGRPLY